MNDLIDIDDIQKHATRFFGELDEPLVLLDADGHDLTLDDVSAITVTDESQLWLTYYTPIIVGMLLKAHFENLRLKAENERLHAQDKRSFHAVQERIQGDTDFTMFSHSLESARINAQDVRSKHPEREIKIFKITEIENVD